MKEIFNYEKRIKIGALGIGIFIISYFFIVPFCFTDYETDRFLMSFLFTGVPFGWRALNRITPKMFIFLPVAGWVIYFVLKFCLSLVIGLFILIKDIVLDVFVLLKFLIDKFKFANN